MPFRRAVPGRLAAALGCLSMVAVALGVTTGTGRAQPDLPRFRAGTNLVRVDAYVSARGIALTDLTVEDFEVLEDDTPQKIESVALVRPRDPRDITTAPAPASTQAQREEARDPDARLFVLYLDRWHVGLDGSARSAAPVEALLDKVAGPRDLVGVMTPDITPQNLALVRKGDGVGRALRDAWYWGERDTVASADPREEEIRACYPDAGATAGIAADMVARRREQKTLRSIDSMVSHLGGVREERKFVLLISEGWEQFRRDDRLGRPLGGQPPGGAVPPGVGPGGRLSAAGREAADSGLNYDACERERVMLSYIDHELEVRQIAQRANRANVSFYTLDPRGLVVFDGNPVATRAFDPDRDRVQLSRRHDGLKVLAEQTDGAWILNTNDTAGAVARLLGDTGSYYLLSYYSSNPKYDGRFRRIAVTVRRADAEVRHRIGYLAPTEAEARAADPLGRRPAGASPPPGVSRALAAITPGRGAVPLRVQATGLASRIRTFIELDVATARQPEWQTGGSLRVTFESDKGAAPVVVTAALPPGQRSIIVEGPDTALPPGRYYVRVEGRPERGTMAVRAATDVAVGAAGAMGSALVAYRRGPTTGLAYQPTADPRFTRTERLRAEAPVLTTGAVAATARILTREGQPLPLQVTITERVDEPTSARYVVADVALAPLAQGDYVLEVRTGTDSATYGFRIVP